MAKYLLLKHYRGGPAPIVATQMDQWAPNEVDDHIRFMGEFAVRLQAGGEFVDAQAVAPTGAFVRSGDDGAPIVDGPFAETKDLIAGWMVIDVDTEARAHELAAELSSAPGPNGEPIHEWIEVRPFLSAPPEHGGDDHAACLTGD